MHRASAAGAVFALALALVGSGAAIPARAAVPNARATAGVFPATVKVTRPGKPGTPKAGSTVQSKAVTLTWSRAKANGAAIGKYQVKSSKGRTTTCAKTTCRITGLANGVALKFTVRAHNRKGWGAWSGWSRSAVPSGKPLGLSVADPKQGSATGRSTNVTVSWSLGSPNGPKPMASSVVRSDGKKICSTVHGTSCVDDAVAFDGRTYRYTVTAVNATGGAAHSATATSPAWTAVGTPDDWGTWKLSATGSNGGATLGYAVPASRGGVSTVTLLNNGAEFKSLGSASTFGQEDSYTASGLDNGTKYNFSLRVCNEIRCITSSAKAVTPFGPLSTPSVSASASGPDVSATASANGNGAMATLTIYIDGVKVAEDSGTGQLNVAGTKYVGYSRAVSVTARLTTGSTDPSRGDGAQASATVTTANA
jgi:hypothetical protein